MSKKTDEAADTHEYDAAITDAFKMFDKDGRNYISVNELGTALKRLGFKLTPKEAKDVGSTMDKDKNGKIDLKEFRDFVLEKLATQTVHDKDHQIKMAFQIFDIDGNGVIDKQELKQAMKKLGEKMSDSDVASMLSEADCNDDGVMDFKEFKKLWKSLMP